MASSRIAQAKLLTNPAVTQQLTASLLAFSIGVLTEGTGVTNHPNRLKYANFIIGGPANAAAFMLPAILSNANNLANAANTPDANGTPLLDADIDATVSTVFTFYANQYVASAGQPVNLQLGN